MLKQTQRRDTGYVSSEGENIYFERTGHGPVIVLCHGLGGNHAIWWRQIEPLAADHTVVTWDQRGFGNSTARSGDVGPPAARRDLHKLFEQLDLKDAVLVGQSMGGWTALGYALEHPDRLSRLVLSTTLAGSDRLNVDRLVNAEPDRDRINRREHPVLSSQFCRQDHDLGILYNQISSFGTRPDPAGILKAMAEDELGKRRLEDMRVKTLVLMAQDDHLCPPSAMQAMVARLPSGKMQIIPGNHSAYYERPDSWNEAVLSFCDDQ